MPTVFKVSLETINKLITEIQPDIAISVGQVGGRSVMLIERVAINIDYTRDLVQKGIPATLSFEAYRLEVGSFTGST